MGCILAAVIIPAALFGLFERQARRLDALAAHGEPVEAYVTAISQTSGTTYYAYRVDGVEHRWSVARDEAPCDEVGQPFQATYLPEDPSLSRPIADRALAAAESSHNRSFARKVVLGVGLSLALLALVVHVDLRRLHGEELSSPKAVKRRLTLVGAALTPLLVLIFGFHAQSAIEGGESLVPIALSIVLVVAIIGGVFAFTTRRGPSQARERAVKILRWAAPVALGLALLRLLALILGG